METYLARSFNTSRLSYEQGITLHIKERNQGRALMPYEIQALFSLPSSKEAFFLPDVESALSSFMQSLRAQFRALGLVPPHNDFSVFDLDSLHVFDEKVREKIDACELSLVYSGSQKKRLSSTLEQ